MNLQPIFPAVVSALLAFGAMPVPQLSAQSPSLESAGRSRTSRIIVRFSTPHAIAETNGVPSMRAAAIARSAERLGAAVGRSLSYASDISEQEQVLQLAAPVAHAEAEAIAQQIATQPGVEYAVPDEMRHTMLTPDDALWAEQWHYFAPTTGDYGIDVEAAWEITTGTLSVNVAVIDTGILPDHPDFAGRLLPGYDFVSMDPSDSTFTRDGNGRDSDPSDPGTWGSASECGRATNSSWHGSHVAGTMAAASNNATGVAGVNWVSRVVSVRVLAKCGSGYDSDIIAGMRWAAGLSVPGIPANTNPARVINLSLGGDGPCTATWQAAVNEVVAAGSVLVMAAGNENQNASLSSPGNCANVITVAASSRSGDRASYSNFGSAVEIAAPGGGQTSDADRVLSVDNAGTTGPGTHGYDYKVGTSMAAPHVAGIASLMLSLRPDLTPARVTSILRSTVTAFPSGSTCNTTNCGSGIANARLALEAVQALPPLDKKVLLPYTRKGPGTSKVNSLAKKKGL